MEMRQLVANPELQGQLIEYAKQACAVFPSFQPTCEADVDQYAPMVFGMMLAYLQPDQVCIQLKMCPPPSLFNFFSLQTSLLGSKVASFSIITTTSTPRHTSSSSSSSVGRLVATKAAVPSGGHAGSGKVHGPGLALPMAS